MAQDLRDMLKGYEPESPKMRSGHEARFEALLEKEFPAQTESRKPIFWMKIAASFIVLLSLGYVGYKSLNNPIKDDQIKDQQLVNTDNVTNATSPTITLGSLSPDLKKVEEFYTAGISMQLASLNKTPENEELINGYLRKLEELDKAYQALNAELNEVGPSEATITALIENLQLRLELLFKLKNKLNELKNLENETVSNVL